MGILFLIGLLLNVILFSYARNIQTVKAVRDERYNTIYQPSGVKVKYHIIWWLIFIGCLFFPIVNIISPIILGVILIVKCNEDDDEVKYVPGRVSKFFIKLSKLSLIITLLLGLSSCTVFPEKINHINSKIRDSLKTEAIYLLEDQLSIIYISIDKELNVSFIEYDACSEKITKLTELSPIDSITLNKLFKEKLPVATTQSTDEW